MLDRFETSLSVEITFSDNLRLKRLFSKGILKTMKEILGPFNNRR